MKELTLQDLDDGVIITMPDNSRYKLHRTNFILDISEWSEVLNKLKITLEGCPQPIIREQENIMKKDFSKVDLESGMRVVLRNGQCRTVFKDTSEEGTVIVASSGNWSKLEEYDENFCFEDRGLPELDIDFIYTVFTYEMLENTSIKDAKDILWKREEKTQEQIIYEALQAQIADEENRHNKSMKALREQAEKLKPKQ